MRRSLWCPLLALATAIIALPACAAITERVSVSSTGEEGNGESCCPGISADGRYVAFVSGASNLVPGDTNASYDVFVHDWSTGATERVSVSSAGEEANSTPYYSTKSPAINADGRYVVFVSEADNLVPGDTNGYEDVFVHDRATGVTERVSVSSTGEQANGGSESPAISANGRYVAFSSWASNLVPGDTNGGPGNITPDVFVHDRATGVTERVSVSSAGEQGDDSSYGPAISADGRYVAFGSSASNFVVGDTYETPGGIFVRDRALEITGRVSVSSAGEQGNSYSHSASISADGRYVAFASYASNLVPGDTNGFQDVFVHDRATGTTERVSLSTDGEQGNGDCSQCAISADGRYVAFVSEATNLVSDDTNYNPWDDWDVFVRDRQTGATERVNVSTAGEEAEVGAGDLAMSANGRYVAFESYASNLVPGDTNGNTDVFVRGPGDVILEVGEAGALAAGTAAVPISLTQTAGIAGIQFDLEYAPPPGAPPLELIAVHAVGPTAGWIVDLVELVPGERARVIAYSPTIQELPSGSGPVLELDFLLDAGAVIGDTYTLHPRDILLSDHLGDLIKRVDGEDGSVVVLGTVVLPDEFRFDPIPSPGGADLSCPLSFPVRIEARYAGGALAPTYNGAADLLASCGFVLAEPAGPTMPAAVTTVTFSRGVWEGEVSIFADQASLCSLTVADQAHRQLTGESDTFAVRVKSDPTDDGEVNVLDVLRTVSIALGRGIPEPPASAFQFWAADANCDAVVNIQDVMLVVYKSLGLSAAPAQASERERLSAASDVTRTVSIYPASAHLLDGGTVTLALNLDEAAGVAGFQFDISYNGALMEFVSPPRPGTLLSGKGWLIYTNQIDPNLLRVLAYSPTATELPAGAGSLVALDFHALGLGTTPVALQEVVLSSGNGTSVPATAVGGTVTVASTFPDVPTDHWAYDEVMACVDANIVKGYDDGLYHPELSVGRDQMAVYIARALVSPSGDASIPDPEPPPSFSDVPPTHWAYKHIEYAVDQGVVAGYDDGTYQPGLTVDRGQMAVYVARAMVAPGGDAAIPDPVPPATFPDAAETFWAYKQVEYCVGQGVVKGYDDGLYHPERQVTRDQMAVYIAKAFGLL